MTINIQYCENRCKVAILGQLEQRSDKEQLLVLLKDMTADVELHFYDAELLPSELLIAISEALTKGYSFKIIVYRELLVHTLARLNIPFYKVLTQPLLNKSLSHCRAVVLAGSARSLDKILHIISCLPVADLSVFVIQHIQEDQTNLLDKLLKVMTAYRVIMPHHLMPIETGVIYIAPPAYHLKVAHGLLYLTKDKKVECARPSIDVLFESIAYEYGEQAIAVLLCGFGQDGVRGCAILREKKARVLLEKMDECQDAYVLLEKVYLAGHYDYVLSGHAIASILSACAVGVNSEPSGQLQELFLQAIKYDYGYDLLGYQRDSLERRIKSIMVSFAIEYFADFQCLVLSDSKLFQRFMIEMSVGVSYFFRHFEQLKILRHEALPYLASFPLIKIWSAGCATGEEAYSLAILLQELGLLNRSLIFATDINPYLLELAKIQLFPNSCLTVSRENYINSAGIHEFDDYIEPYDYFFKMKEGLIKRLLFHCHSLAQDGVFNEFELIVCRNVLIYFDQETQKKILRCFANSLHSDGFLLLGSQDGLQLLAREMGFVPYSIGSHLYKLAEGNSGV